MKNKIQKQRGKRLVMGKASWKALVTSLDKLSRFLTKSTVHLQPG